MPKTAQPFLKVAQLVSACGLLVTVPITLGAVSGAGMMHHASSASAYVAMGDSYASGEGLESNATSYISPSNTDGCHRSVSAYPVLVATSLNEDPAQFETYGSGGFVACSGATSRDVVKGENGEPAQLGALSSTTRWVTITAGGDDLHFSTVLFACLDLRASVTVHRVTRSYTQSDVVRESKTCSQYLTSISALVATTNGTSKEEVTLEHLYEQIFVHAPNAELAVVNYPQLFTESPPAFCPVARAISLSSVFKVKAAQLNIGYSPSQISQFNGLETALNADIASAVGAVRALGRNIALVDVNSPTKAAALPCNLTATGASDMNALRFSSGSPLTTVVQNCHFALAHLLALRPFVSCPLYEGVLFLQHVVSGESFHPKRSAHEAMARGVEALFTQVSSPTTS